MVAPHAVIFIEFQQMVQIANNINISVIKFYNNNVILYNINIIVHYGIYQVSIRPVGLVKNAVSAYRYVRITLLVTRIY